MPAKEKREGAEEAKDSQDLVHKEEGMGEEGAGGKYGNCSQSPPPTLHRDVEAGQPVSTCIIHMASTVRLHIDGSAFSWQHSPYRHLVEDLARARLTN